MVQGSYLKALPPAMHKCAIGLGEGGGAEHIKYSFLE